MTRSLRCRISRTPAGPRIDVTGRLTGRTRQRVVDAIWRHADAPGDHVTVDLTGLTYFDSESLLVLLGTERIAERQRGCVIDLTGIEDAATRLTGVG